jgi:SAM-dependent methyltransferase
LLLRLGRFIQSLPVVVMRPDDLVEFSRQSYGKTTEVDAWAEASFVDSGLTKEERSLLEQLPDRGGNLLLLGVGGGREAVPLARMGYHVTGVDYVAEMVERAKENAARRGLSIRGLVQDISQLDVESEHYDVVWLSWAMYSFVPGRTRRVQMVRRIERALKPGGWLLCQFQWRTALPSRDRGDLLRRLFALATLGNLSYEAGDMLWLNVEFVHEFSSEEAVRSELEEGGLSVLRIETDPTSVRGRAICRKDWGTNEDGVE